MAFCAKRETSTKCDSPPLISCFALILCKMLHSPCLPHKTSVMQASTWSPDFIGWNPKSRSLMDSFTWGGYKSLILNVVGGLDVLH